MLIPRVRHVSSRIRAWKRKIADSALSAGRSDGERAGESGSCSLARAFAPRFLQTPPYGDALARFAITSPLSGCEKDFHLQVVEHARHTKKSQPLGWPQSFRGRDDYQFSQSTVDPGTNSRTSQQRLPVHVVPRLESSLPPLVTTVSWNCHFLVSLAFHVVRAPSLAKAF